MIVPSYLKPGDHIAIVSPAKAIDPNYLEAAKKHLERWELTVHIGDNAGGRHHQFSGTDEQRAADMQEAVNNEKIKAVFCARGGYGTIRIIDKIDFTPLQTSPKWFIGFSDITVLHNHLHTHLSLASIHGPVPLNFDVSGGKEALGNLRNLLFNIPYSFEIPKHPSNRDGESTAQLVGGNLAILAALCGTNSDIDTSEKILFLEDVGEYMYRIDRLLWQLKKAGKFNAIAGIAIGQFTSIKDGEPPFGQNIEDMVLSLVPAGIPVVFNVPSGHEANNQPLIFGADYTLQVNDKQARLILAR